VKIKARGAEYVEIDYTPMIDMTFQLIAFFMILINFGDGEQDQRVQLPSSAIAKPPQARSKRRSRSDGRDGKIIMNGQLLNGCQRDSPVPSRRNSTTCRRRIKTPRTPRSSFAPHKDAKTGLVQQIIKVCQEIGSRSSSSAPNRAWALTTQGGE